MKKLSRIVTIILVLAICLSCVISMTACNKKDDGKYKINKDLDTSKEITLKIVSSVETWAEMMAVATKFTAIYPNCTFEYEYIEDYGNNLATRLNSNEQKIDIFRTLAIQESTEYKDNALNLISEESKKYLDLSHTHKGIVDNFKYLGAENTQYAIPYGGEMRGMYVNVTLLQKYGLTVPTNRSELLHCCEVLYQNGYIPFQSSNGTFAQQLLYPAICNSIVNGGKYEETKAALEELNAGISEYFREPYEFLYDIVAKGYYDYKKVEKDYGYTFSGSSGKAKDFLNIIKDGDSYTKQDDVGNIAFLPDTQAFGKYLEETKSDYHSNIEYVFITSPVGKDGGYAYLSPADGLGINKNSDNIDWSLEFLDFFFSPDINTEFAKASWKIPNTADALLEYDVPANRVSDVGQVTFSYNLYKAVTPLMCGGYDDMVGISKMNATKYMKDNGDGTYSIMYTVDDYLARLETELLKNKK